jgi:hypothetical protein
MNRRRHQQTTWVDTLMLASLAFAFGFALLVFELGKAGVALCRMPGRAWRWVKGLA